MSAQPTGRPEVQVRLATPDDAAMLAGLGERTFRDTYAADNRPEDMEAMVADRYRPDLVAEVLTEPTSHYLVGEVGGEPAGFALLRDQSPEPGATMSARRPVAMEQLYVERRFQGLGLGAALLEHCRQVARAHGHDVIWLSVWERNPRAIAFYRSHGFTEAGEVTFTLGGDRQRDLLMVLPV